ncbi:hypothetical protein [Chamaesiphon sp.]|uniref:hypothetical protein n=1 Tax=Chamaesiphon sp. TaxID=2814140 RepID=UPI003593CAD5
MPDTKIDKHEWIELYGSACLRKAFLTGYNCNRGYLDERLSRDYPEFEVATFKHLKMDTPPEFALDASIDVPESYCAVTAGNHFLVIDNYLEEYQIVRPIIEPCQKKDRTAMNAYIENIDNIMAEHRREKDEWISLCGSDDLQQAYLAGYDCQIAYAKERVQTDHPGFGITRYSYGKADAPLAYAIEACFEFDRAYCCENRGSYYIAIDNYLGTHQIVKLIPEPHIYPDRKDREDRSSSSSLKPVIIASGLVTTSVLFIKLVLLLSPSINALVKLAVVHPVETGAYIGHEILNDWNKGILR